MAGFFPETEATKLPTKPESKRFHLPPDLVAQVTRKDIRNVLSPGGISYAIELGSRLAGKNPNQELSKHDLDMCGRLGLLAAYAAISQIPPKP